MKRPKSTTAPVDLSLAPHDGESLFPRKVAQARALLAKTNLTKLEELLAKPEQAGA